jgi:NAD-dependent dihydropyrimidine dehydrogenase PreA subunit
MTDPDWITAGYMPDTGVRRAPQIRGGKLTQEKRRGARSRNEQRCPRSDLLWGQCACQDCRPDLAYIVMEMTPDVLPGFGSTLDEPTHHKRTRRMVTIHGDVDHRCKACDDVMPVGARAVYDSEAGLICLGCGEQHE